MTVANVTTLCLTAASYAIYSRLLTPAQFAIFGTALTVARVSVNLLDGGIRNILIADQNDIAKAKYSAISVVLLGISVFLAAVGWAIVSNLSARVDYFYFILLYVSPFLLSYPFFFSSMVQLERKLSYERVAIVETVSVLIELALPALLILETSAGLMAFVISAFISRTCRTVLFWSFASPAWGRFGYDHFIVALRSVRTSLWFQYAILANAIRDNLPILLVGPFFGPQWAGYYVWALQICAVSSQFAVAAVSRIALPVLSGYATDQSRYDVSSQQIRWLSKLLSPVLVAVWLVTPIANTLLFHDRWGPAIVLLPWLLLRMVPSIATTTLAPLTFVQFGPRWLATATTIWTVLELLTAWLFLHIFGPSGLAYSYAICIWLGLAVMVAKIPNRHDFTLPGLFRTTMLNRPLLSAVFVGSVVAFSTPLLVVAPLVRATLVVLSASAMVLLAYASDAEIRTAAGKLIAALQRKLSQKAEIAQ